MVSRGLSKLRHLAVAAPFTLTGILTQLLWVAVELLGMSDASQPGQVFAVVFSIIALPIYVPALGIALLGSAIFGQPLPMEYLVATYPLRFSLYVIADFVLYFKRRWG